MNVYHLYAKDGGFWHFLGNIYAQTYDQAHREAIAALDPWYYDKSLRLDYDADAPSNQATLRQGGALPASHTD